MELEKVLQQIIKLNYSDQINKFCTNYLKNHANKDFNKFKINFLNLLDNSSSKSINIDYDENWALKEGNYFTENPTEYGLEKRKKYIDEIYIIYYLYNIIDGKILCPEKWSNPPQYCYEEQLKNNLEEYSEDYMMDKKKIRSRLLSLINNNIIKSSIDDDLYMDNYY